MNTTEYLKYCDYAKQIIKTMTEEDSIHEKELVKTIDNIPHNKLSYDYITPTKTKTMKVKL